MKDLVLTAQRLYDRDQPPGAFADALLRCLFYGVICDRLSMLILAEPCYTDGKVILPPPNECNCWWIHFAACQKGEVSIYDMLSEAPYPLEYVAFRRRGKTKIHTWDHLRRDIYYGRSPFSLSTAET